MDIAIVTRTKNRPLLLERAMKSVLDQTWQHYLMVVINDGGDPDPVNKLATRFKDRFSGRLIVLHNDKSIGMEGAAVKAIQSCQSKYVTILDDDDTWFPTFLEKTIGFLEACDDPQFAGAACRSMLVEERIEGNTCIELSRNPLNPNLKAVTVLGNYYHCLPNNSFVYRRDVYDCVGMYNPDYRSAGDVEFMIRFLLKYDIWVLPEELACYHIRPISENVTYNNSINDNSNQIYTARIANEWLRRDIERGVLGIGVLLQLGIYPKLNEITGHLETIDRYLFKTIEIFRKIPIVSLLSRKK